MSCFQQKSRKPRMATTTRDPITIPPTKAALSSFITISIPHSKIRIRIPKLLANTIKSRQNNKTIDDTNNSTNDSNQRRWTKPRTSSPNKSSLRTMFGSKRRESPFAETEEVSGILEGKGKRGISYEKDKKNCSKQSNDEGKKSIKIPSLMASIFNRKESVDATKPEKSESCYTGSITSKMANFPTISRKNEGTSDMRNKEIHKRVKGGSEEREIHDRVEGGSEKREGSAEGELCKKRILMGEKCKPLNLTGVLQYDQSGVLVPEY